MAVINLRQFQWMFCALLALSSQAEISSNYEGLVVTSARSFFTSVIPSRSLLLPILLAPHFTEDTNVRVTTGKPGTPLHREQQSYDWKKSAINKESESVFSASAADSPTRFAFELPDGSKVEEESVLIPSAGGGGDGEVVKRGRYEYRSPDGAPVQVKWIADERGFRLE